MFFICIQKLNYQFTNPMRLKEIKQKRKKENKKRFESSLFFIK